MMYGHPDLNNPFYVASCGLLAQVFLRGLTGDFHGQKDAGQKKALMLGLVNLVTGLIILSAIPAPNPSNFLVFVPVTVMSGTFLLFGVMDTVIGVSYLMKRRKDGKEFREEMKQVAEVARMEAGLAADLAEFLAGFEPTDTENKEN